MEALTFKRVNLLAKFEPVNYNLVRRIAKIDSIRIIFWDNGEEKLINANKLSQYVDDTTLTKILSCEGDFTIVNNKIFFVVED